MTEPTPSKESLRVAADAFRFVGDLLPQIYLADRVVDIVVRVDHSEVRRRRDLGVGVINDIDVLSELAKLPYNFDVDIRQLDDFSVALLRTLSEGVVDWRVGSIRRVWQPALVITGFLVTTPDWRRGLRRVSLFAADAPRGLVYTGERGIAELRAEAAVVGVGVGLPLNGGVSVILEPDRHLARAEVPQWLLSEELLARYLADH